MSAQRPAPHSRGGWERFSLFVVLVFGFDLKDDCVVVKGMFFGLLRKLLAQLLDGIVVILHTCGENIS